MGQKTNWEILTEMAESLDRDTDDLLKEMLEVWSRENREEEKELSGLQQYYNERDEEIKRLRFEEGLTLESIAERYDLSRERIRQIVGNTGHLAHEKWREEFNEIASDPMITNHQLANMFDRSLTAIAKHREGWHMVEGDNNVALHTEIVYHVYQVLESLGMDAELMPLHGDYHILVGGKIRISVRASKGVIPPSQEGRLVNPQYHFHIRKYPDREHIHFFILVAHDVGEMFIVPSSVIPRHQNEIGMTWPTERPEIGKYQKYRDQFSLIKEALQES